MQQVNPKSITRIAAVQTLYCYENSDKTSSIQQSLNQVVAYYKAADGLNEDLGMNQNEECKIKPRYSFLLELVNFTFDNLKTIDNKIASHLTEKWTIDRLPALLLCLLRTAIAEITCFSNTPVTILINEYTNIANDFLDQRDIGFVNSILENCAKTIRT